MEGWKGETAVNGDRGGGGIIYYGVYSARTPAGKKKSIERPETMMDRIQYPCMYRIIINVWNRF